MTVHGKMISKLVKDSIGLVGGNYGVTFYNRYSGRGMYGKECVGIVGQMSDCMAMISEIIKDAHLNNDAYFDDISDELLKFSSDNMGLDMIYYWKDLPALEDDEEDDLGVEDEQG